MLNIELSGQHIQKETKVYHTGFEHCRPSYGIGPFIRDHFLIHFVTKGQGVFKTKNKEYLVKKDMAFIIYPGEITHYNADFKNPWAYYWVGFQGENVPEMIKKTKFNTEQVIEFDFEVYDILKHLTTLNATTAAEEFMQTSYLYELFSNLTETHDKLFNSKEWYVEKACDFIKMNYSRDIKINDISTYLKLDRSYFSRIFNSVYGISPQEYLINFRMEKAKKLLSSSKLKVSEVSLSVGYSDPYAFAKAFKKYTKISPKYYKLNSHTSDF